jgi:hypothetical protein
LPYRLCTENNPAEDNEGEGEEDLDGFFPCREETSFGDLVGVFAVLTEEDEREEEESMVCTPSYKSPISSMPKARKKEDNKSVADNDPFLVSVGILDR